MPLSFSYKQILFFWFCMLVVQTLFSYYNRILAGTTIEKMLVQLRHGGMIIFNPCQ